MSDALYQFVSLDLPAGLTATLAAIACGLLGNFLVLRRLSLMGDAISHSVLPGLVLAFLITGSRASLPMFVGAAIAGVITAVLVEAVRKLGRVETGAAMGVVFSVLFALGVVLLEQAAARQVDLDPDCVLNGQLERVFWFPPRELSALLSWSTLAQLPRELLTVAAIAAAAALFIVVFYKELKLTAFDPALATALGFSATRTHFVFMVLVAAAVVASFEAVGSIVVIAMLICPAATARLLTDRLGTQILLSAVLAAGTGAAGYWIGAFGPGWVGWGYSISVAGTMAVLGGVLLAAAVIAAPRHGVVARAARRARLAMQILSEDVLGLLYRAEELRSTELPLTMVRGSLGAGRRLERAIARAVAAGDVIHDGEALRLSDAGRSRAASLVRSHRLWETFLVRELGLRADHVHRTAMDLEHVTSEDMRRDLAVHAPDGVDPMQKPIPPEST